MGMKRQTDMLYMMPLPVYQNINILYTIRTIYVGSGFRTPTVVGTILRRR